MAWFITRVELHAATWQDYENLHAAMRAKGFSQQIRADNGLFYQLPPAEYFGEGTLTAVQVRDIAQQAADQTFRSNTVLTMRMDSWASKGLAPVAARAV